MRVEPSIPPVPPDQGADRTPEDRGLPRDGVRLLLSTPAADLHRRFSDLPEILRSGDLLVVNESATLPASLPARGKFGEFRVSVSTAYGPGLWVVEPRRGFGLPGPVPLAPGDHFELGGLPARYVADFPNIRRLGFVRVEGDLYRAMSEMGRPVRYGYLSKEYPLSIYQTAFARIPGSAEMPSAGRPFTPRVIEQLEREGVAFARILLHCGVSSLEPGDAGPLGVPIYPEPFWVPPETAAAIERTRAAGGRVIAVGTTVVRALESAVDGCGIRPARGFTRLYLNPERPTRTVDGLLTGFHDATSTHLALLAAVAGADRIDRAYRIARAAGYLWHEFGDTQLILLR